MSDVLKVGSSLTKRVIVRDFNQVLIDLSGISLKVFQFVNDQEVIILDDASLVKRISRGIYYIDLYLDPVLYVHNRTYHVVLRGIFSSTTISTELFTYSFIAAKGESTLHVEFG